MLLLWTLAVVVAAGLGTACRAVEERSVEATPTADPRDGSRRRDDALASARVWRAPAIAIADANLGSNPRATSRFDDGDEVVCRFSLAAVNGTTPKFNCELPSGELLKIKYGRRNPELHAEVAASRLLTALGFMADHMFVVRRVRCAGCPRLPFQSLRCLARVGLPAACMPGGTDYDRIVDFDVAVVERKLQGDVIEAFDDQGWAWFELDRIDPAKGGSTPAEVDAFRLMAVFLAHWDNKGANQRLICPPDADRADGSCAEPLAIMQDLGATFGPLKVDLHNWRRLEIWKDASTCTVSMEHLPWGGGTFPERSISEAGRRLLLGQLEQLSAKQLHDLFEGSRVTTQDQLHFEARRPQAWVRAFEDKVAQIRAAGPCPS